MAKKNSSKQKKMNARVDFTPMVDMIMLLVTFFMLCTSLIKPQTLEIVMPSNKEDLTDDQKNQVAASKAVTILIAEDNKLYYYTGLPDTAKLQETEYGKDGIRRVLLSLNRVAQSKIESLKREYALKQSSDPQTAARNQEEYKDKVSEIKNSDVTPNVIIKAEDNSNFENLIQVLDEMQICWIGKYVIDNIADGDLAKIKDYQARPAK
ncbi:biopolymer transport protein ExbD/TolR [Prevotella sp. CAG:755]|nr:biopolymer transport protein ExbD/TolR [Prevotella sp. CAG:755]